MAKPSINRYVPKRYVPKRYVPKINKYVPKTEKIEIIKYSDAEDFPIEIIYDNNTIRRIAGSFANYSIELHNAERRSNSDIVGDFHGGRNSVLNCGKLMKKPIEDQIYFAMADNLEELRGKAANIFENPAIRKIGRQLDRFCYTAAKIFEGGKYQRKGMGNVNLEMEDHMTLVKVANTLELGLTSEDKSKKGSITFVDDPRFVDRSKLDVTFDIADDNATYEYSIPFEMDGIGEIRSTRSERSRIITRKDSYDINRKNFNSTLKKLHIL